MHSDRPQLIFEHVSKVFNTKSNSLTALKDVSFTINEGEFVCVVGPSGCGKSTLLNLIAGLQFPDNGGVFLNGHPVIGPGNDRMVIFQEAALFPWLDVLNNVLFGLKLKKNLTKEERLETALFYLRLMGLEKFVHCYVHELSGGMKQRVALARGLAPDPEILLMDEPFAALDAFTREQLYGDIQRIWEDQNQTIVFITHNVNEAACLGDRVFLFSPNPGRLKKEFKIDLPRPRDIRDIEVAKIGSEITHILREESSLKGVT